jgi:hypothetical protein
MLACGVNKKERSRACLGQSLKRIGRVKAVVFHDENSPVFYYPSFQVNRSSEPVAVAQSPQRLSEPNRVRGRTNASGSTSRTFPSSRGYHDWLRLRWSESRDRNPETAGGVASRWHSERHDSILAVPAVRPYRDFTRNVIKVFRSHCSRTNENGRPFSSPSPPPAVYGGFQTPSFL